MFIIYKCISLYLIDRRRVSSFDIYKYRNKGGTVRDQEVYKNASNLHNIGYCVYLLFFSSRMSEGEEAFSDNNLAKD